MHHEKEIEIGLVVYPGAQQAAVLGLADLFGIAAGHGAPSGPALRVTYWRQPAPEAAPERDDGGAAGVLHERHAAGAMLASVCVGAFVLAGTGLMAGRRLTTPHAYAAALRRRHPDVRVDADQPLVDDGDVITAGGLMHWPTLGLRLVERFLGPDAMLRTARALLVDPPGGWQPAPGVFAPRLAHGDAAVLKARHWLQATHAKDVALASLARAAGLEERTFLRRFQKATGMTSTEYCQRLRVGRARELLASGRLSIDRVAWEVGYADPGAFRKVFTRIAGVAPGEYRRRCEAEQGARAA
jgi:transcriptional regulator GlxA family with amidase domain